MTSAADLGEDLAALVRAHGEPLLEAVPLSRRGPARVATTFRLRFASGAVLKGMQLSELEVATRVLALVDELGALAPRVVASGGVALLTEWIDGEALGTAAPAETLRRCGAAQARVHERVRSDADPQRAVAQRIAVLFRGLETLANEGRLATHEREALAQIALCHAPAQCSMTLSLGDYCAENIVCRPDGAPCLVDLETIAIGPSEHDLGRTWYRWPMTPAQRAAFLDGYRAHRDPESFLAHLPFWHMGALVQGALYRHRQRHDDVTVPIAGLRQLMARRDR